MGQEKGVPSSSPTLSTDPCYYQRLGSLPFLPTKARQAVNHQALILHAQPYKNYSVKVPGNDVCRLGHASISQFSITRERILMTENSSTSVTQGLLRKYVLRTVLFVRSMELSIREPLDLMDL